MGVAKWKDCVVGHLGDPKLPFMAVKTIAHKMRKVWPNLCIA